MAVRQPVAMLLRALMLALVLLGVALMHTLGHEHDELSMAAAMPVHAAQSMGGLAAQSSAVGDASVGDEGGSQAPSDPGRVCMAVLTMLGMVVGLRLLFRVVDSPATGARGGLPASRPAARGSPWSFSLSLTRVAVLRT